MFSTLKLIENVAGEQGLALQQHFPYRSSEFFKNSNCHKISFFNRGLNLSHFDIFDRLFSMSAFFKVIAHNVMKNSSHDGLAAKGLFAGQYI